MTVIRKPPAAGLSDPSIVRQTEASLAQSSIIANGKPAVVNSGLVLPSTTITTTSNSVTATTSANNQSADTVTIYETGGSVYVSAIDQIVNKTTINNPIAGVSKIIAGNNVTITSSNNDGTGNITINAAGGGNGSPSGSNTQVQFNNAGAFGGNAGFTFNRTSGLLTAPFLAGNGNGLSNIQGANVSGAVGLATFAGTANSVAAANVSGLGNVALINKNNNTSQVLHGDGTWSANIANWVFNNNSATVNNPGYPQLFGGPSGGPEFTYLEEAGNLASYSQTMYINNEDGFFVSLANGDQQFQFAIDGNAYLPGNIITSGAAGNITGANVINANTFIISGGTELGAIEGPNTAGFYNANVTDFIFELGNSHAWTLTGGDGGTIFPTLTTVRGDVPANTITGQTLMFGDNSQEAIISTPNGNSTYNNSQRLVINPGKGADGTAGEGGDIYLWAGLGGNASGSGGDVKIRGGQGGANTAGGTGGDGGYIRIEAGDAANSAVAGYIQITGGAGGIGQPGGYVRILGGDGATVGGDANITGGYSSDGLGGNVNIIGGSSGNSGSSYGNVNIYAGNGGNIWTFDNTGKLTAPGSGYFAGQNMFVGAGSETLGFSASTLVISANNNAYIQAAVTNVSDIGSADWVAYGHRGNDNGGWVDMGFTSSGYSDANFTITGQGDGYVFVETFIDGQSPGGRGGNLVLATGENGTVNDIIFATNGFLTNNEFGRISNANNALQFTSGGNLTGANVISANIFNGTNGNLTTTSEVVIQSNNAHGGAGYAGIMTMTNTIGGSTNPNKYVRLNSVGNLQIIDSAYATTLFDLSNSGNLTIAGTFTGNGAGLTNIPAPTTTTRYIAVGAGGVLNINTTDNFVLVNRNGQSTINIILPNNASSGQQFTIKESSGFGAAFTVSSSDTANVPVDGQATVSFGSNTYNSVTVIMSTQGDGTGKGYWITSQYA